MSFGESTFLAGFIQKTVKVDQIIKLNHVYPRRKLQKVLEDTRRHSTEVGTERLLGGIGWFHLHANWSPGPTCQPPLRTLVLHHLKDCISAVYSSWFDPRAQD